MQQHNPETKEIWCWDLHHDWFLVCNNNMADYETGDFKKKSHLSAIKWMAILKPHEAIHRCNKTPSKPVHDQTRCVWWHQSTARTRRTLNSLMCISHFCLTKQWPITHSHGLHHHITPRIDREVPSPISFIFCLIVRPTVFIMNTWVAPAIATNSKPSNFSRPKKGYVKDNESCYTQFCTHHSQTINMLKPQLVQTQRFT